MEETKNITIKIVQRDYNVRVKKGEEELFLRACDSIKESLQFYAQKSAHRDKQDLMAMVLLQAVVSNLKQEERLNNVVSEQDLKIAKDINNLLDQILKLNTENNEAKKTIDTKQASPKTMGEPTEITDIDMSRKIEEDKTDELTLF